MASQIAAVAAAVVTALNAGTFSISFTSKRKWVPGVKLQDLSVTVPTVTVVAKTYDREPLSRGRPQKDIEIDIGIQRRLSQATDPEDPDASTEVDDLIGLLEEIADLFTPGQIGTTEYRWVKSEIYQPFYDPQHLRQRVFTGVAKVSFRKL